MSHLTIFEHPVILHKMAILRDKATPSSQFRKLVEEITILMCYEALKDLPTEDVIVETPVAPAGCKKISGKKLAVVPILRAGLGMVEGVLTLVPSARVGHIGMYRDEETLIPHAYYCKLPSQLDQRPILVVDPMLATGGSACDAIAQIKSMGGKNIKFMCLVAAPQGLNKLQEEHPDVDIFCASLDDGLNENGYIVPGLGDAGDRIFGIK